MNLPVIVIGAGGHAKVLIDALLLSSGEVVGIVDADQNKKGTCLRGVPVIGDDEAVLSHAPDRILLVNGIGSIAPNPLRRSIFKSFKARGYSFASVIHPSAVIAADVEMGEGVQVMAGAVIQAGCVLGADSIINTRATLDHDCRIGAHVHVAPGVTLSGNVSIDEDSHIGTGATVIQGIKIGRGCLVAAGAVVVNAIKDGDTVMGVPARSKIP